MDLQALCLDVVELCRQVGMNIKIEENRVKTQDIEEKSLNSLVSYVDKNAEESLVEGLSNLLSEAGYIAEEGTSDKKGEKYNWIIDPLDGTTNFLHGLPVYSVSVGLERDGEVVLGVVYEVNQDECFYAWKDGGAYLNQDKIQVSQNQKLADSLLATGFPYYDYERVDDYFKILKDLAQNSRGIRRMGSAAVDLVYTACGRFDAFFEYSLHPWDVAAGALIVKEAGGEIFDFSGKDNWLHGKEIVASTSTLKDEILERVKTIAR
ncbi:MAG: inositol monophosphatase family protein [Vicingaceae bacterium]